MSIISIYSVLSCKDATSSDNTSDSNKHTIKYTVETSISPISVTINGKIDNNEKYNSVNTPLGEVESKSVRFTANSRTIVVNVSPQNTVLGRTELNITVSEAK